VIQRILYKALSAGIQYYLAHPEALDTLFGDNFGLETTEIEAIKTFFANKTPKVFHGYPRLDQIPPFYSIVLGDERESDAVLGDEAGMDEDEDDPDYGCDQYTRFWNHTYHVLCITEHPEATSYIYEIAKTIILEAKPTFIPEGIYGNLLSGTELLPDPRYIPEIWFVRQLTYTAQRELKTVLKGSNAGKAWKVGGIHIDGGDDNSDIGGVKSLVTVVP